MNETTAFTLACRDGAEPPVLRDVAVAGRLAGTLFELTLRQTYRNTGSRVLEVVYTFPLLPRGVLLGFGTELNGARMEGSILPRRQAEQTYEAALADGDAPVMLEAHADGLHTANIGNLKPGDEIVVEVRMAQVAAFEQGRLRLAFPSTIAPRYGNPGAAGLQPQQAPLASLAADYPLAMTLHVAGALADAAIECPTHKTVARRVDDGLEIALAADARLDRDVIVIVTPRSAAEAVVMQSHDARAAAAPTVLLATLPVPAAPRRDSIALKLLVDCSGSMGGDSMLSARRALNGIAAQLAPADAVSLTRFGSTFEHVSPLALAAPATLAQLARDIERTDANLGGTEMEAALAAVFALPVRVAAVGASGEKLRHLATPAPGGGVSDVLLITDGEVWQVDAIIETAKRSAQRVFVIGVGASPAEGVLRRLAQATGGACEFATPGEALEAAATRMLDRIRQEAWSDLRIDWGAEAAWQGALPLCAFGGDTLDVFAGVRDAAPDATANTAARLISRTSEGVDIVLATATTRTTSPGDTLPRVAAAGRLASLEPAAATALAVDYGLMSAFTNCVLVHVRVEADKSTEDATLQRVEGMLAAGWGATGSVFADTMDMESSIAMPTRAKAAFARAPDPAKMLKRRAAAVPAGMPPAAPMASGASAGAAVSVARSLDADDMRRLHGDAPLTELATTLASHFGGGGSFKTLDDHVRVLRIHDKVREALDAVIGFGVGESVAWILLAQWLDDRLGTNVADAFPESARLRVSRLDAALASRAGPLFEQRLGWLQPAAIGA